MGLTTALVALRSGWVIVGSLPTQNGGKLSGPGCLIVLDPWGQVRATLTHDGIDGPWDMTAVEFGNVRSSNQNIAPIKVPANGATTTETISITL